MYSFQNNYSLRFHCVTPTLLYTWPQHFPVACNGPCGLDLWAGRAQHSYPHHLASGSKPVKTHYLSFLTMLVSIDQWFSTKGDVVPQGTSAVSGNIFWLSQLGMGDATRTYGVVVRDAANILRCIAQPPQ